MRPSTEGRPLGVLLGVVLGMTVGVVPGGALAPLNGAAQVVFDDTFGAPGLAPTEAGGALFVIEDARGDTVASGGRTHVFHSFERFDLPSGQGAEFRTADVVDTIFSRVTGPGTSTLAGSVSVTNPSGLGGADLVLINPNGVLVAGTVRLDLDGAFTAASADAIGFADGAQFSAVDGAAALPATAAAPSVLRFEARDGRAGGDVEIAGRLLSNDAGGARDASGVRLVGRDVVTSGAGFLVAEGATIELAAVGDGALDVPFDLATLSARDGTTATGSLRIGGGAGAPFNVTATGLGVDQGRIVVRGGELVLREAGLLAGGDGTPGASAIDVDRVGAVADGNHEFGTVRLRVERGQRFVAGRRPTARVAQIDRLPRRLLHQDRPRHRRRDGPRRLRPLADGRLSRRAADRRQPPGHYAELCDKPQHTLERPHRLSVPDTS